MGIGLKIGQKGLLLVALPSVFEIVFVIFLTSLLNQAEHQAEVEAHSKAIIACANDLTRGTVDSTTAAGAYKITNNPLFAQRADMALDTVRNDAEKLRKLLKDKPHRLKDLENVQSLIADLNRVVSAFKAPSDPDEIPTLQTVVGRGQQFRAISTLVKNLGVTTNSLIADELKIEKESPKQKARTRQQIRLVLFGGVAFNVVLAFVLAAYFSRSVTRRLLIVRENTERLAQRQELVPLIGGVDEIADLDAAFHKAASRLKELEQFKQQLIGIVSHELKTPLSSMQVNIALMSSGAVGELNERATKKLGVLESNVVRLIRLINDLLDIEKMESGKFELILKDCNLATIIETAVDATTEFVTARQVELLIPQTNLVVHADQDRLVQVIVNFISNAAKYSEPASKIRIELSEHEDFVELAVVDSGRGIPESHLDKIFDRFQQVDKTDETEKGGTGLGLAICKAIIEQHEGGKIGVRSKLGEGSSFWFRVKKVPPEAQLLL